MAYFHIGNNIYIGVTADTKPTNVPVGSVCIDRQIPTFYVYNGSVWNQISAAGSGITASSSDTLTNKDLTSSTNIFRAWLDADIGAHTTTKISTNSKSLLNANLVYNDQANVFGAFNQTFQDTKLKIINSGNFNAILSNAALTADRTYSLPDVTGTLLTSASSQITPYDYFIYKSGSTYIAVSGDALASFTTSNTDFKTVLAAVIANISPAGTPTLIKLGAGDFNIATQFAIATTAIGNIKIDGSGMGLTNLVITSAWNGITLGTPAIKIGDTLNSTPAGITGTLTANCPLRSMTLTVSTSDAAKFAVGDLILLTSTLAWSTAPSASSPQAEIKKITAINSGTGVITFDVPTFDSYNTTNTAVIYRLTNFLKNIKVSNLSIIKGSGLNTDTGNTTGVVFFRAACIDNFQMENVQLVDNVTNYDSGINLVSCINSAVNNCYIYQNPSQTYNLQYGITLDSCCQNVVVSNSRSYGRWRHPFEMCNDQSGTGLQGIGRNNTASNCTSEGSEVASFDCHPGGEMISFNNCKVLGTTDTTGSVGFEIRTRKSQLNGCSVEGANTYGIQFSGDAHDGVVNGCVARGCVVEGFRAINDAGGVKRLKLNGNAFSDNGNNGIRFDAGCDYATIVGNTVNANANNGMYILDSDHLIISNNIVTNNTNKGIWLDANAIAITNSLVTENDVTGNATNILLTGLYGGNTQINNNINGVSIMTGFVTDPFSRRTGSYTPTGNGTTAATVGNLDNMLSAHTPTGTGTNTNTYDTTEGTIANLVSTTTINQNIGLVSPTGGIGIGRRLFGMRAKIRCKVDAVSSSVSRFYFGFTSATALPISDTPLATTDHGIIVGFSSTDTTYQIYSNDGATSVTKTAVTGSIAKDTNYHTIEIIWQAAGNITVVFDNVPQLISTDLPATTANLFFNAVAQNATAAARTFSIKGVWVEVEK